jgi:transcriptional regulator with XRE-family HTH domain
MTNNTLMHDPEIRRSFEEELLVGEATDTLVALIESLGLTQKELADRLGVSAGRVSQILSGAENLTLRSLGALGWALGIRFDLQPTVMADREGTPAREDPPAPAWLNRLHNRAVPRFGPVATLPERTFKPTFCVRSGEVAAAS